MTGLVSCLFLLTLWYEKLNCTVHTLKLVYQPYGPQMCKKLCDDICGTFYYVPEDLSCHTVPTNDSAGHIKDSLKTCSENRSILTNCTKEMTTRKALCEEMCRITYTAKSTSATFKSKDTNTVKVQERSRIIVGAMGRVMRKGSVKKRRPAHLRKNSSRGFKKNGPIDSNENKLELRQMSLLTKAIKTYTYIEPESVHGLAYIVSLNRLVIATPSAVLSAPLDASGKKVLKEMIGCLDVTVDDDEKLIFMATKSPTRGVSRMTTKGKDYRVIIEGSGFSSIFSIALDVKHKRVFHCISNIIFSAEYQGRKNTPLVREHGIRAVTFDNSERVLYYNAHLQLKKMLLSEGKSTFLMKLPHVPWKFVFHRNYIYIGYYSNPQLSVFKVDGDKEETEKVYAGLVGAVYLCVIPNS